MLSCYLSAMLVWTESPNSCLVELILPKEKVCTLSSLCLHIYLHDCITLVPLRCLTPGKPRPGTRITALTMNDVSASYHLTTASPMR